MRKQNGITLVVLTIMIVVMMILVGITVYIGKNLITEAKFQDLKTNMLLMQAEAKKGLEEVKFQKLDLTKEDDKVNADELLFGESFNSEDATDAVEEFKNTKLSLEDNKYYYYLTDEDLEKIGMNELSNKEEYGYFVLIYDVENIEVVNTHGYHGNFTLKDLNKLENESEDIED